MDASEIAAVLAKAGWVRSRGGSEGFGVTGTAEGIVVYWTSPAWNPRTMERMIRNYEQSLRDRGYTTIRRKPHLVVTGKK